MLRGLFIFGSVLAVLFASLYQLWLKDFLAVTVGVGRVIQKIEEFPYKCRRLEHKRLAACEDLWLDDDVRVLYAACTGTQHRLEWNQAMDKLNVSGRRAGGAELMALDIDSPGPDGLYNMRSIQPVGYLGAAGDTSLDLVGFDAVVVDESTVHFYFVNQRPPVDAELKYLDASKTGANATIDVFEHKRGAKTMRHLRTVSSPEVFSPNNVAALGDGSFVTSNDHSAKVGLRKQLDPILGGGNVAYCSPTGECHAATGQLKFPNGLAKGKDGLIYVPSTIDGTVRIYSLGADKMLNHLATINVGMPLDNLAVDANGDLYVPGGPDLVKTMKTVENPYEHASPVTVWRIWKANDGYHVKKVLEDGEAKVASLATTVRHDAKTGRLFMGGAFAPYLVICDPS